MKRVGKRFLALLCMFAMLVGTIWTGQYQEAQAESTNLIEQTIATDWNLSAGNTKTFDAIKFDSAATKAEYKLHLKIYIPESVYNDASTNLGGRTEKRFFVELTSGTMDKQEFNFTFNNFVAGENEVTFSWDTAGQQTSPNWGQDITYCRVYFNNGGNSLNGVIVREMKVVRIDNADNREWRITNSSSTPAARNIACNSTQINPAATTDNLRIHVKINVTEDAYATMGGATNCYLELRPTTATDSQEFQFTLKVTQAGDNEWEIPWAKASKAGSPSLNNKINYIGLFYGNGLTSGVSIVSITVTDISPFVREQQPKYYDMYNNHTILVNKIDSSQEVNPEETDTYPKNFNPAEGLGTSTDRKNLALYLSIDIPEDNYNTKIADITNWRIIIKNTTEDLNSNRDNIHTLIREKMIDEASSTDSETAYRPLEVGLNEWVVSLADTQYTDWSQVVKCVRIYCNDGTSLQGVKVSMRVFDVREYAMAGMMPSEIGNDSAYIPNNYTFAGWYTDAACTSASALEGSASGTTYAKYVRKGVQSVQAQATTYVNSDKNAEWVVCENQKIVGTSLQNQDVNIDLSGKDISNLSLYVELDVPSSVVNQSSYSTEGWRIKFSNSDKIDGYEHGFNLKDMSISSGGVYAYTFPVHASTNHFSFDKEIVKWRIYCGDGTTPSISGVTIKSIKFVYTDPDAQEYAAIRFVTTVDSVQYQKVGFDITINGRTLSKESTVVYDELYAVGADSGAITYVPTDIDPASKYFNTFTIENIPSNGRDMEIKVQSYWITQDGAKVLGELKTYTVNGVLAE